MEMRALRINDQTGLLTTTCREQDPHYPRDTGICKEANPVYLLGSGPASTRSLVRARLHDI